MPTRTSTLFRESAFRSRAARVTALLVSAAVLASGCATTSADYSSEPAPANRAEGFASEAGPGIGSVIATALYAPIKVTYAVLGTVVGGLAWAFTGGNSEVARRVIAPAVTGDYVLTPDHLRHPETIHFVGHPHGPAEEALAYRGSLPPVSAAGPVDCDRLGRLPTVNFASGRSELSREAAATLDSTAAVLRSCPDAEVAIQGHADSTGTSDSNLTLSAQRAERVRRYLIQRGVDADRLSPAHFGEERPASTNATREGRAQNRRVELPVR